MHTYAYMFHYYEHKHQGIRMIVRSMVVARFHGDLCWLIPGFMSWWVDQWKVNENTDQPAGICCNWLSWLHGPRRKIWSNKHSRIWTSKPYIPALAFPSRIPWPPKNMPQKAALKCLFGPGWTNSSVTDWSRRWNVWNAMKSLLRSRKFTVRSF